MKSTLLLRRISFFPLLLFFSYASIAQKQTKVEESRKRIMAHKSVAGVQFSDVLQTPTLISFNPGSQPAQAPLAMVKDFFQLSNASELKLQRTADAKANIRVERYKEYFKGVLVEHSAYIMVYKNDKLFSISAEAYGLDASFSTTPALAGDAARTSALRFSNARKYAWDALEEDKRRFPGNIIIQQRLEKLKAEFYPDAELVIAKDVYGDGKAHLAYKFSVYSVEPLRHDLIYVNAKTGKIMLRDAVIKHAKDVKAKEILDPLNKISNYEFYGLASAAGTINQSPKDVTVSVEGSGQSRYSGTVKILTTKVVVPATGKPDPNNSNALLQYSGVDPRSPVLGATVYILQDQSRGKGIETYDMNGVGGLPLSLPGLHDQSLAFVDKDNIWRNEIGSGAGPIGAMEDLIRGTDDAAAPPGRGAAGGGAEEANNDDLAIDAHWGAEMVYDYWLKRHNRASFDDKNAAIKSYIHYGPAYDNAFWNGSVMTYGDGSGAAAMGFKPLVSLDVCGHEVGHGVCSFTSDLIYESESGAMNEGLSDIWAAAVENFVDDSVKQSSPPYEYEYFQIGEDIDPGGVGIRRMDNPKAFGDPDTYGGVNWKNPNCTPSLANDQCGVHSNSGVLNKWFYLMVMGPKKTTGTAPNTYTDDGISDNGNDYGSLPDFKAIGFEQAEAITYLMEQVLTPTAKFAEARIKSIDAARALYGDCSQPHKTVTNAWFAVGVGPAFGFCMAPLLSIKSSVPDSISEAASGDCPRFKDVKFNTNLTTAQTSKVTISFTYASGTLGSHEYQIIKDTIEYAANTSGIRSVPILRLFDDAMVEGNEEITITATSSLGVGSGSFKFNVKDDDVEPTIGGIVKLLDENFDGTQEGSIPASWARVDKLVSASPIPGNRNQWAVRTPAPPGPSLPSFLTKRAIIEQTVVTSPLPPLFPGGPGLATYDQAAETRIILSTPLINGRGLDSLRLEFTYQAGGEPACSPNCDYGQVMYSYDRINFSPLYPEDTTLALQLQDTRTAYDLPQQLSNKEFYIGFLWYNDANAGSSLSLTIEDVLVTGKGKRIAEDSADMVSEPIAVEGNKPSYLFSKYKGGLLSRLVATSNLGCVKDTLVETGDGFVLSTYGGSRSRKVHQITPAQNGASPYTLTLYYTDDELTGVTPGTLNILKTNAANINTADATNSVIVTPIRFDGDGYWSYTASFKEFSLFALVTQAATALPLNLLSFTAVKQGNAAKLTWVTSQEVNVSRFEIERSTDGATYKTIGTVTAAGGSGEHTYTYTDGAPNSGKNIYRLKMIDIDGKFKYSELRPLNFAKQNAFVLSPNPAQNKITLQFEEVLTNATIRISNQQGQLVKQSKMNGSDKTDINISELAAGVYVVEVVSPTFRQLEKLVIRR